MKRPRKPKDKQNDKQKNKLSQSKAKPKSHEDLFGRLPDELILKIAGYSLDDPKKLEEIHHKKINQGNNLVSGRKTYLWLYQHNPQSPIMTSLQSFSIVNRRIYCICRPIIWKSLKFPSDISSPMSLWNQEILPRHGCYVEVLDVGLRSEWLQVPKCPPSIKRVIEDKSSRRHSLRSSDINKIKFIDEKKDFSEVDHIYSDNLAIDTYPGCASFCEVTSRELYGLGLENVFKVLSHCENLTTLKLTFPTKAPRARSVEGVQNLSGNLTSLFSDLKHLKRLKIQGTGEASIFGDSFTKPIARLTFLESLELAYLSDDNWELSRSLPTCLSNLKSIKQLVLKDVDVMDGSWICHKAPPQLIDLKLLDCNQFTLTEVPFFLDAWSPHLTHLELRFNRNLEVLPTDEYPEFDPDLYAAKLPELTHLTIWPHSECHFVRCFAGCKNLRYLKFHQTCYGMDILDELSDFSDFIITTQFPHLKSIEIPIFQRFFPLTSRITSTISPLGTFCKSQGIKLKVFPDGGLARFQDDSLFFRS
ncbi:hypothetical protein DFH28DRAFT_945911 [Melampsora americana]|nr:hypothetical protein DFH28DRAFT_945911 [Melampsora americana]